MLRAREEQSTNAAHDDVSDFKDLATRESEEAVDEFQAEHAAHELEQVLAARRRLQELTYGLCRLSAMPATPYCASCQSAHEQLSSPSRH